jgi:hypothetical protein
MRTSRGRVYPGLGWWICMLDLRYELGSVGGCVVTGKVCAMTLAPSCDMSEGCYLDTEDLSHPGQ